MILLIRVALLEKYDGGNNCFDLKRRFEALSGEPCLLLNHTQVTTGLLGTLKPRAVVMSGFGTSFAEFDLGTFRPLDDLVKRSDIPILALCGSHQLLAHLYNYDIDQVKALPDEPMRRLRPGEPDLGSDGYFREQGFYPVRILKDDPLFRGIPNPVMVRQAHYCEVKTLPEGFELLASTDACKVQAMRHRTRPVYGTQFHPEAYVDRYPDGRAIMRNFFSIAGIVHPEGPPHTCPTGTAPG